VVLIVLTLTSSTFEGFLSVRQQLNSLDIVMVHLCTAIG